jgi:pimeloyl-ACP methyl ester carboxylesterase
VIDHGHGTPVVLIPGLPGPWRFVAPAVHALSRNFRVLALSLGPECTLDSDVDRIVAALDERRIDRAVICGISLGGLIALRFAARHPGRTSALVLVSTPGPGATLQRRHRVYTRWPWLCGPLLMLETPILLWRELRWSQVKMLLGRPVSFGKMARRARLIESTDIAADCARVTSPTLVVTGERALDRIVPVDSTLQLLRAIPDAQHVTLAGTGHLGALTDAETFLRAAADFVERVSQARGRDSDRVALRTDAGAA